MKIAILGSYVVPVSSHPIKKAGILIEEGIIQKVGYRDEILKEEIDLIVDGNLIVMPGLINTHTHAAMVGFRGLADDLPLMEWLNNYIWPMEKSMVTPDFIKTFVELASLEMVLSGTTTFADMYFFQQDSAEVIDKIGLRAVLAEGIIDFPTPSKPTPEQQMAYAQEFISNWLNHPLITPAIGPHAPYSTSPSVYRLCYEISQKYGIPLLTHVAETRAEIDQVRERYGTTPINHLNTIGVLSELTVAAHCVYLDDMEIEILLEKGCGVAHCPESNMKLASGVAKVHKYLEHGLKVGLATDGASSNNDLDMFGEMRTTALLHKVSTGDPTVMSADKVLYLATLGAAEVLGLQNKVGSLEPGKEADVITLDLDSPHLMPVFDPISHIVYTAKGSDVRDVFVKGNPLLLNKEPQTIDVKKLVKKVKSFNLRMLSMLKSPH